MPSSDRTHQGPGGRLRAALEFARSRLGPESEKLLLEPGQLARLESKLSLDTTSEDAALAQIFESLEGNRDLQNEFFGHILDREKSQFSGLLPAGLRRFVETGDLVQSIFGDLLADLSELWYENRAQFLALLLQRMRWKAADHDKNLKAGRRREELRVSAGPEALQTADDGPSPASRADERDREERLVLALMRLKHRDRELVRMHLKGVPIEVMCESLGLKPDAARKALQRALHRARALL